MGSVVEFHSLDALSVQQGRRARRTEIITASALEMFLDEARMYWLSSLIFNLRLEVGCITPP
jgi:hypothetical protein